MRLGLYGEQTLIIVQWLDKVQILTTEAGRFKVQNLTTEEGFFKVQNLTTEEGFFKVQNLTTVLGLHSE